MIRKVAVFTGTRAEYGLLYWLLKDIDDAPDMELQLLVSGTHLAPEFGLTVKEIEIDGFTVTERVDMLLSSDSAIGTVKSLGLGIIGYGEALARMSPDILVVLGDRYEALGVVQAALLLRIPVLHIHGGEITEGAYDDAIRHAITKMSLLHATATEEYRQRVIQLGEPPQNVEHVGAIGLDHLKRSTLLSLSELSDSLGFALEADKYAVVTYHPVTLANESAVDAFTAIIDALNNFPDLKVILTYPNADEGGRSIIPLIDHYGKTHSDRVIVVPSLGQLRYLSALKYAAFVLGNSSSGIIEVPSFNIPTVNIGERQRGRIAAKSVIHCSAECHAIINAISDAIELKRSGQLGFVENPYGQGDAVPKILKMLRSKSLSTVKTFYNLPSTDAASEKHR